ncbi:hypothetical protein F5Y12DRAFT_800685 [Xylaria sp. FL1777]|nr:hypothetical protein F5Y12DRAFT_800685 [Xylaria sp. FL1777]
MAESSCAAIPNVMTNHLYGNVNTNVSNTPDLGNKGISPPTPLQAHHNTPACPESVPQAKAQSNSEEAQSLGILSCVTVFGGSILTLLAVGFLLFLWAGEGPRSIMLHEWAIQSVTLTSLLIRGISAAQAGLCTSMVAALLLERRGVPVSKIVQLSVTRSVKAGPVEFLYMLTSRRARQIALKPEVLLLYMIAFTALGIQFSSTILISDFGTTRVVQNLNRTIMNVAFSPKVSENIGFWGAFGDINSATVLFGELDSQADAAPNQLGVSDTGIMRRAFLPFQKEDRIGLQYFSGATFALTTRVTCIRPSMLARLRYSRGEFLYLEGTINFNQSLEDAGQSPTQRCYINWDNTIYCLPTTFNCTVPAFSDPLLYPMWPTALCHLILNPDFTSNSLPDNWEGHTSPFDFPSGSWAHLVFASNIPVSYFDQLERSGSFTLGEPIPYGEWVSHEVEPGKFLNTTLCFTALNGTVASLTMTGHVNQSEPNVEWNITTGTFEAEFLQGLFGAERMHKTPAQRGLFSIMGDMQNPVAPSAFNINTTLAQDAIRASSLAFSHGPATAFWQDTGDGGSVTMCRRCNISGYGVSDDIAAIFLRIINTTGRSTIALDTYLAMLSRSWYYYLLPKFDVPSYVDLVSVVEVLLPIRWRGLTAVLVLVGVNTVLMWIIAALYIRRTRFSLAGNYWHAVAQLVSTDTISLLEKSSEMQDDDVMEQLDLESEDFLVKIDHSIRDGRVTVVKV